MTSTQDPVKRAYTAPEWLNRGVLPAGVTDDIATAVVELEAEAARLLNLFIRIAPALTAYRTWANTLDAPDGVKDAIDEVVGFARLDMLFTNIGQATTMFGEDLDMTSVLKAFDRVLTGDDPRSVLQIVTELRS